MNHTEGHPLEHVLAEAAEGALDATSTAQVNAHVRGCASCQGVLQELAQVSQLLRAAPTEVHMPEHVSARLEAALAAETAQATATRQEAPSATVTALSSGATRADRPVAWFRRPFPRVLAAAAAAAVIGVAGYGVFLGEDAPIPIADGGDDAGEGSDEALSEEAPEVASDEAAGAARDHQLSDQYDGDTENAPADPGERLALEEDILGVWHNPVEVEPNCGAELAAANGADLIGSTEIGTEILVVVQDDERLLGWTVTNCTVVPEGAEPAVVDVPSE